MAPVGSTFPLQEQANQAIVAACKMLPWLLLLANTVHFASTVNQLTFSDASATMISSGSKVLKGLLTPGKANTRGDGERKDLVCWPDPVSHIRFKLFNVNYLKRSYNSLT